ncbi:MAG TPA: ATP-binding cassette domain-containing protein [bacterium]|nr:ATP-binding cassette domain-containing protein [bacterium]
MSAGATQGAQPSVSSNGAPLLELKNLKMHFPITTRGLLHKVVGHVKAVDDVSLTIRAGETFALVGESGCGKTTLGRCIIRIYDPTAGAIHFVQEDGTVVDLATVRGRSLKPYRRAIRLIFQDPYSSLNPRRKVLQIIGEPLIRYNIASGSELEDRVADLLRKVGLRPEYILRYPHAFSGGERQRIGIARALALQPRLVIADEAVSALDVSVQAQILNLLQDLQAEFNLTYLFIAHDLSVVEHIGDRVAVMYVGKLVELGSRGQIFTGPKHPYTEALMSAVPKPDPRLRDAGARIRLEGEVADPANPPSGCYFHPRCRYSQDRCKVEEPVLRDLGQEHLAACHFAEQLQLKGVERM